MVSQHDAGLILNHMRGTPETWAKLGPLPDVMATIVRDLDATVHRARAPSGGPDAASSSIPGLGFGKRKEQNSDHPVAPGRAGQAGSARSWSAPRASRFLAQPTEKETEFATAAAVTAAILGGAHIVRVHDVRRDARRR